MHEISWKQDNLICLWVSYTAFQGNLPNLSGMIEHTEIYDFTFSYVLLGKVKDKEVLWNKISLCNRAFKIPGFQSVDWEVIKSELSCFHSFENMAQEN